MHCDAVVECALSCLQVSIAGLPHLAIFRFPTDFGLVFEPADFGSTPTDNFFDGQIVHVHVHEHVQCTCTGNGTCTSGSRKKSFYDSLMYIVCMVRRFVRSCARYVHACSRYVYLRVELSDRLCRVTRSCIV